MGILVNGVLTSVFIWMNYSKALVEQYKFLLLLATLTTLVPYLFCTAAYIITKIEKTDLTSKGWFSAVILFILAFCYSLWAIAGTGQETVYFGFILLMTGIPFYALIIYRNKKTVSHGN